MTELLSEGARKLRMTVTKVVLPPGSPQCAIGVTRDGAGDGGVILTAAYLAFAERINMVTASGARHPRNRVKLGAGAAGAF